MVKNLPANAGDTGSIPDPGRSHMAAEQLTLCIATAEPVLEPRSRSDWRRPRTLEPSPRNKSSHCNKKPALATAREKPIQE